MFECVRVFVYIDGVFECVRMCLCTSVVCVSVDVPISKDDEGDESLN